MPDGRREPTSINRRGAVQLRLRTHTTFPARKERIGTHHRAVIPEFNVGKPA